jgi:hypothetical protein
MTIDENSIVLTVAEVRALQFDGCTDWGGVWERLVQFDVAPILGNPGRQRNVCNRLAIPS